MIATKCGDITVDEFNKFDNMSLSHSYDEVLDIIEEVRYHPNIWHNFGDRKQIAIEWNYVEMALNGYEWPTHYGRIGARLRGLRYFVVGDIRMTWRILYNKYMFDRTDACPFEDQLDFLWDFRAEAYWIWDDEECVYKRPLPIEEDAPSTSWSSVDLERMKKCYPCQKDDFFAAPCPDCGLYHPLLTDAEFSLHEAAFYPEDMDHDCFNTVTCVTTRQQNAFFCYIMKNFEKEHCKEATRRVVSYLRTKRDDKDETATVSRKHVSSKWFELDDAPEDQSFDHKEISEDVDEAPAPVEEAPAPVEEAPAPVEEVIQPEKAVDVIPVIQDAPSGDHILIHEAEVPEDPAPKASETSEKPESELSEEENIVVHEARQPKWKDSWEMLLLAGLLVNLVIMLMF